MQAPDVLVILAVPIVAFTVMAWFSPYICKETASLLLSHAEATEKYRKIRKQAISRFRRRFVLRDRATN